MEPLPQDVIVDISATQKKSLGTSGKMLLPCPATVEAVLQQIPASKLMTTELLRKELAAQFNVDATCPFNTKLCLRALANDASKTLPYWRVLKKNGDLLAYFPGGVFGHAAQLRQEGFIVDITGKIPKVKQVVAHLVELHRA
jgi:6-O-methylguanine DNA methyltransferase, DNA binding domain